MNLIKKRKYNLQNRLYIEAAYLNSTEFKIGKGLKYNINYTENTITIIATDNEARNHVSGVTQTRTKKVVPVIDLRKSDIKEFLNNVGELEVSVYEDKIIFSAIANEKEQLNKELLRDSNNNIVCLASHRSNKSKSFAVNVSDIKVAAGAESSNINNIFTNISNTLDIGKLKKKCISMISLFSGAGLLDKAFLDNGNYKIKFAIDRYEGKRLKRYHIETYKSNIGEHIIEGDVLELKKEDIPQVDLVVGGVPCTKFSLMNTKDNFRKAKEEEYKPLEQFINIVKWSGAKGFLIENVKGFITAKGGVLLDRVKERLHDFNITYKIINSKDLGSAQSRERVFILGFKDIIPSLELPKLHITRTVRDVFKNIENAPQQDLYLGLKGKYLEMAKHVPPGGNGKDVPTELRPNRKFDNFIQRLDLDSHANTITGLDTEYILHPTENRKLSVREVCRIFGMPDDFILKGSNTSIFTQLKNGVDYHVGKFLANTIYNQMVFTK